MSIKNYERFSDKMDFSIYDYIVIGSGIGGLTTAVWLSKLGKKVVVLEKHYVPGGYTHSFKRNDGFQWDVGVHYVGNVGEKGSLRNLFQFLTHDKLEWESMGEVYDVVNIGSDRYEFKAGKDQFIQQLKNYFPDETRAIDQYVTLIFKANKFGSAFFLEKSFEPFLSKSLGWIIKRLYRKYYSKTTYEVLSTLTTNKRLITVLCGQCGNYGLAPKESNFAAHAMVIAHFIEGGYYPKGGADQISNKIIDVINTHGGKVVINAPVTEIVLKNNRVEGVKVNDQFIPCKNVISNVGVNNTFNYLLPKSAKKSCNVSFSNVAASTGHMCLYVGLDQSSTTLNLPKYNIWNYAHEDIDDLFGNVAYQDVSKSFSYISFPSAKDPEWDTKKPNTATIQALSIGKYEWFKAYENTSWMKRGEVYNEMKKHFETTMLQELYRLFPQIEGHVVYTEVSTPLSTKHFSNYKNGEIYGLQHTPERFKLPFLRPQTKIKGLHLVGQDITLVGVAGAMLSGMLCAITILKFRVWRIFKEIGSYNNSNT